jgi:hypothetical protein
VLVACGPSSPAAPTVTTFTTRRLTFQPWTSAGALLASLRASTTVTADCEEQSIADAARSAALRCFAGDEILDPCFVAPSLQQAACLVSPWDSSVTVVHLMTLPSPSPPISTLPWAIELTDGEHCLYEAGATQNAGDKRLNYGCRRGGSSGLNLWGAIDQSHQPWTILASSVPPADPAFRLTDESIAVVWS